MTQNRRTEESPADDLEEPTSGTNRQSCQGALKSTAGLCWSWGWTFWTFTLTAMYWLLILLLERCYVASWLLGHF